MAGLALPSNREKLELLWSSLEDPARRQEFMSLAHQRRRFDAIEVACAHPAPMPPLPEREYRKLVKDAAERGMVGVLQSLHGPRRPDHEWLAQPGDELLRTIGVEAIGNRQMDSWKWWLAQGLDPLAVDRKMGTSLAYMIATHDWIEGLDATGLPADRLRAARDAKQRTLLHGAARYAHPRMVRYLLDLGFDPSLRDANHRTPLFLCVAGSTEGMGPSRGRYWMEATGELLDAGCSLDERIGKTDRSATLREYVKDRCADILPEINVFEQQRQMDREVASPSRSGTLPRL